MSDRKATRWRGAAHIVGGHKIISVVAVCFCLSLVAAVSYLLQPSADTAFAISARSDVLTVEPLCSDHLLWDLPAGHVIAASAPPESSTCEGAALPVSVELRGGASAQLRSRTDGRLDVRLQPGPIAAACQSSSERSVIAVLVDGQELPADAQGYVYRSGECSGDGAVSTKGVLTLGGRMRIGAPIPEGAGWGGSSVTLGLLRDGELRARHAAAFTGERLTLMNESIDPGSIIDTLPCLMDDQSMGKAAINRGCLSTAISTPGFVQLSEGVLDIQLYPIREIGVTPHRGIERRVRLTNWDNLKHSAIAQVLTALFAVLLMLVDLPEKFKKLGKLFGYRSEQEQKQ